MRRNGNLQSLRCAVVACAACFTLLAAGCDVYTERPAHAAAQNASWATAAPVAAAAPTAARPFGQIQFVDGYQLGFEQAARQGRPMLLFFTATWCHYCHQMEAEALVDPRVVALSGRFVCVRIDADREPGVCQKFQVQGFPTVQFIAPRGERLQQIAGMADAESLLREMQATLGRLAAADGAYYAVQ